MDTLMAGWTTVEHRDEAQQLAKDLIENGLAACVQVEGPVESHYCWEGQLHADPEYRLMVKFAAERGDAILAYLNHHHPYDVPQWYAMPCSMAHPGYVQWVMDGCDRGEAHS